tara:strand:- start:858 stop:1175 length:318 start_codon:yes stop_codon:yes gene_type:complete
MNRAEQEIINQIDSMSIKEARDAIANGQFGDFDSPNQNLALFRLIIKESSSRDEREEENLSIARSQASAAWRAARYAMYAAIVAIVALIISNQEVIISSVSMFIR